MEDAWKILGDVEKRNAFDEQRGFVTTTYERTSLGYDLKTGLTRRPSQPTRSSGEGATKIGEKTMEGNMLPE